MSGSGTTLTVVHLPNPGVQAQVDREAENATFDSWDLMSCMTPKGRNTLWMITAKYISRWNQNLQVARNPWKMKKKKIQKTKKILHWNGLCWCHILFSQCRITEKYKKLEGSCEVPS